MSTAEAHAPPDGLLLHLPFDGSLNSHGTSPAAGELIGKGGQPAPSQPEYREGRFGQSIYLSGNAAVRLPLDLNFEFYPQITVSAWIYAEGDTHGYVFSNRSRTGPTLNVTNTGIGARAPGAQPGENGVLRPGRWLFVAGVWDIEAGTMRLHYGSRSEIVELTKRIENPAMDVWIGAWDDSLAAPVENLRVDDVRAYGRALTPPEIAEVMAGGLSTAYESSDDESEETSAQQQRILSDTTTAPISDPATVGALPDRLSSSIPVSDRDQVADPTRRLLDIRTKDDSEQSGGDPLTELNEQLAERNAELLPAGSLEGTEVADQSALIETLTDRTPLARAQLILAAGGAISHVAVGTETYSPWGNVNVRQQLETWEGDNKRITEIAAVPGQTDMLAVADFEEVFVGPNAPGLDNGVRRVLQRAVSNGERIDVVALPPKAANDRGAYFVATNEAVYARGVPAGAVSAAQAAISAGSMVTAAVFPTDWSYALATTTNIVTEGLPEDSTLESELRRLQSNGERIEDIVIDPMGFGWNDNPGSYAIATNKRILGVGLSCNSFDTTRDWAAANGVGRSVQCVLDTVDDCHDSGSAHNWAASPSALPGGFREAVQQATDCNRIITSMETGAPGQWVVATGRQVEYSASLPSGMRDAFENLQLNLHSIDAVAMSPSGGWIIAAEQQVRSSGIDATLLARARAVIGDGNSISSIDIHPGNSSIWVITDSKGTMHLANDPSLLSVKNRIAPTRRKIHEFEFMPDGSWVLLAEDHWFVSAGAPATLLSQIDRLRTLRGPDKHRIDDIEFGQSKTSFLMASNGYEPKRLNDPIWQVENGLLAPDDKQRNIWERLKAHQITGASIAMVRDGEIKWSRGYGLSTRSPESFVHPDTIFDAASISKPIAAFGIMQLVQAGKLDLDSDGVLKDLEVLFSGIELNRFRTRVEPEKSNLTEILQHCAGLKYRSGSTGAGKYNVDATLPTIQEMILGKGKAKLSNRILRERYIKSAHIYSGANFVLAQALIEVHGGSFVSHMSALFEDLAMHSSTYRTPTPGRGSNRFARGFKRGEMMPHYAYPEMAAASLTTTAPDLANFVIAVNDGGIFGVTRVLSDNMVRRYLMLDEGQTKYCGSPNSYSRGVKYGTGGFGFEKMYFRHGGVHNGYRTQMFGFPDEDSGLVLLVTGHVDDASAFIEEVTESVADAYGL